MTRQTLFGALAVLAAVTAPPLRAAVPSESCDTETVQAMAPADTTVTAAVREAGMCRVSGYVTTRDPGPNKVLFVVGMPDNFNGRYVYLGVGGAAAYLPTLTPGLLAKGYALAGSNAGTGSTNTYDFSFKSNPAKYTDFLWRGVRTSASASQQIVKTYYKRNDIHRYISGCSGGGQMGLGNALRFGGENFDGFIIGATVWPGDPYHPNVFTIAQHVQKHPESWLSPELLKRADAAILAAYDGTDGAIDGIIHDERDIAHFDLDILRQAGFTPPQIETFNLIHQSKHFSGPNIHGDGVIPGFPVTQLSNWSVFLLGTRPPPWPNSSDHSASELAALGAASIHTMSDTNTRARYPGRDYVSIDDPAELTRIAMSTGEVPEDPKDFSKLDRSGAKMIFWHGVNDDSMSYYETLKGYEELRARFPGSANWLRAFTVPGLWHCRGGSGPTDIDETMIETMASWVEKGAAPESAVASRYSAAKGLERTFKLCAEPRRANLVKPGLDPLQAENWVCKVPAATAH
jgi:Tannase and feruloyl esterase